MRKRILIVEDEQKSLKLVRDLLQVWGYSTFEATDGENGVRLAREKRPDLILMDIHLPIMDGVQASKILKEDAKTREIPILVLSAFAMDKDKERAVQSGCDGFLSKPIDIKELLRRVKGYISK